MACAPLAVGVGTACGRFDGLAITSQVMGCMLHGQAMVAGLPAFRLRLPAEAPLTLL
jgi:hypothetical protein